jgi:type III secretion system FlhB-like substrate exporter
VVAEKKTVAVPVVTAPATATTAKTAEAVAPVAAKPTVAPTAVAGSVDPAADAIAKRAERFGLPVKEDDKAAARAARFGTTTTTAAAVTSAKKTVSKDKVQKTCFAFQAGSCEKGSECKFAHIAPESEEAKALAVQKIAEVTNNE